MKILISMFIVGIANTIHSGPMGKTPQEKKIERQVKADAREQRRELLKGLKQSLQNPAALPATPPAPGLTPVVVSPVLPGKSVPETGGTHENITFTYSQSGKSVDRNYHLHLPAGYSKLNGKKYPLFLVLHGGGGSGIKFMNGTTFVDQANTHQFIAVFPDGINRSWASGIGGERSAEKGTDDVLFLSSLIATLKGSLNVDEARIFAVGHSNGGMMVHRLASELPQLFSGISPVMSTIGGTTNGVTTVNQPTKGAKNPEVLAINGVCDSSIPYLGGAGPTTKRNTTYLSAGSSVSPWVDANQCTRAPAVRYMDADRMVKIEDHTPCRSGGPVRLVSIQDAGHLWPGSSRSGDTGESVDKAAMQQFIRATGCRIEDIANANTRIDAAAEIVRHFLR